MSFDGYVKYMTQKYSLAVALAVIKTKPKNIDIEKHLNNIKNKINESKMDSNDEICEEDFQFDDKELIEINNESNDSVTILKDFDFNNLDRLNEVNIENGSHSFLDVLKNIDRETNDTSLTTFLPGSQCSQNSTFINTINEDLTFCESQSEIDFHDKIKESEHNDIIYNDPEQTELYTVPDINTHISQSQDNLVVSKKYLIAKDINNNEKLFISNETQDESTEIINKEHLNTIDFNKGIINTTNIDISTDFVQVESSKRNGSNEIVSESKRMKTNSGDNDIDVLKKSQESYILLNTDKSKRMISQNISSFDEFEYFLTLSQNSNMHFNNEEINNKNVYEINNISDINDREYLSNESNNSDDLTESQADIVTFKVLEELSKVKNYIKRETKNTDSDSGYKSSQTRSSYKSVLSGTCWNESAHCLLNFLNNCPLVVSVMDITEEISKVLGKLIDKLHEEEKYPKFLDEILENVENLINNVHTYGRDEDNSILKIDEKIHRIFLLNRSQHIIKFSIEKITNILENILPEFQNIIEITQTEQTENLCHILHILEILLKRNISYENYTSQVSSQETLSQASQETVLKKSSLTEIWRKKWNLSKSEVFEVQSEKKCIMTKCRDILNKITVEAMECYSLVSFSALQCYNILQK